MDVHPLCCPFLQKKPINCLASRLEWLDGQSSNHQREIAFTQQKRLGQGLVPKRICIYIYIYVHINISVGKGLHAPPFQIWIRKKGSQSLKTNSNCHGRRTCW